MLIQKKNMVACGLTLYLPEIEDIQNVLNLAEHFVRVYVYDNSDTPYDDSQLKKKENVVIISQGYNDGLGVACDSLCLAAKKDGVDYIVLFDQDSRMDSEAIQELLSDIGTDSQVALYCPQVVLQGESAKHLVERENITWCITAGTCVRLDLYGTIYQFDQNYFIDRLDLDFCRQVTTQGYKIRRMNTAIMSQQLGNDLHQFGNIKYSTPSGVRHYYLARNRLYFNHKFGILGCSFPQTLKQILMIFLFEQKKKEKICMTFRGICDYRKHKMGKCDYL